VRPTSTGPRIIACLSDTGSEKLSLVERWAVYCLEVCFCFYFFMPSFVRTVSVEANFGLSSRCIFQQPQVSFALDFVFILS
jgi:hypothetical protein